jgi:hypothetical protein
VIPAAAKKTSSEDTGSSVVSTRLRSCSNYEHFRPIRTKTR